MLSSLPIFPATNTHVSLPSIWSLLFLLSQKTRNLLPPKPNSHDISNDHYLLPDIVAANETQDAIRFSYKKFKNNKRVRETMRQVPFRVCG